MAATPENLPNAQTTEYSVTRTTYHVPGLAQMAPSGPAGQPSLFVRIHAPYEQELVMWTAKREGGPPVVPSPVDPDSPLVYAPNLVLLDFKFSMPVVMPIGAGTPGHIWVVSGYALYGKIQPEGLIRDYKSGTMPWEQTNPVDYPNYFPKTNFSMKIVDPASAITLQAPLPAGP